MTAEQEFARYLRVIGKGPNLSRPLERPEARAAMALVLEGAVAPLQLGALLALLRYRGETAAELAGMVDAARENFAAAYAGPAVDLDWPSYGDRQVFISLCPRIRPSTTGLVEPASNALSFK